MANKKKNDQAKKKQNTKNNEAVLLESATCFFFGIPKSSRSASGWSRWLPLSDPASARGFFLRKRSFSFLLLPSACSLP